MPSRRRFLHDSLALAGLAMMPPPAHAAPTPATRIIPADGRRLPVRRDPPRLGADTAALLAGLGYADGEIDGLRTRAIVA